LVTLSVTEKKGFITLTLGIPVTSFFARLVVIGTFAAKLSAVSQDA
jgi:hypothetical protein